MSQISHKYKRVLVIYTSIGLGHKVVAENIAKELKEQKSVEVRLVDMQKFYSDRFMKASEVVYKFLIRALPALWRFFYTSQIFARLTSPLRLRIASRKAPKMKQYLDKYQPRLILTTQTTATAIVAYLKETRQYQGKLAVTFSDFHFQPFWYYEQADHYLVQTKGQVRELKNLGFPESQITITGLPVAKIFSKSFSSGELYKKFNLSHTKPLVTIMGGSRGWGVKKDYIKELLRSQFDIQLAVITGTDKVLYRFLQKQSASSRMPVEVFGYVPNQTVAELFSISRILVTKPGGLTMAEALRVKLPMVLVNPLPGMEELNQEFFVSRRAAVAARNAQEASQWVERYLQDKKFYNEVRNHMKELVRGDAASLAAEKIIDML